MSPVTSRVKRRRPQPGAVNIDLKPLAATARAERRRSDQELRPKLAGIPGIRVYCMNPPPIRIGGQHDAKTQYQYTLQDADTAELYARRQTSSEVTQAARALDVTSDLQIANPQVNVPIDRDPRRARSA